MDFLLQIVFYSSTRMWLITFSMHGRSPGFPDYVVSYQLLSTYAAKAPHPSLLAVNQLNFYQAKML